MRGCAHLQPSPGREVDTRVTEHFDELYFEGNQQLQDRPALRWYARVCRRLLSHAPREVFEFGCGVGWLLKHLSKDHHVSGYDVSAFCRAQSGAKTPTATVYDNLDEVPREAFDLVVSLHVLEHVPDPAETIRLLSSLLKPEGLLLFVVPALNGAGHRIKKNQWFAYRDETHISVLPEDEWRRHVRAAGLLLIKEAGDGLWDPPYVSWLPRVVQLPLFGAPAAAQVYLGGGRLFVPAHWSECYIAVARKSPAAEAVR